MSPTQLPRRQFLGSAGIGTVAALCHGKLFAEATGSAVIIGNDQHRFEFLDQFTKLPAKFQWQVTHNIACGQDGHIYVIQEGKLSDADTPSIYVFDENGDYVRSFFSWMQGGGHGLEVRREGGEDFLYVTAYQQKRSFAKLNTRGEVVWHQFAPMEAGGYAKGEEVAPRQDNPWGGDRFMPTNTAFHPDGGFFLADGYGSYRIHRYNADGKWVSCFGESGQPRDGSKDVPDGKLNLPHGMWLDTREETPSLVIADRANGRLQWFTLDGDHLRTVSGFKRPANVDIYKDQLLVAELDGGITLLDRQDKVIVKLGDEPIAGQPAGRPNGGDIKTWRPGRFCSPHDACFDNEGNILVAERVPTGRITKLRRLS